MKEEKGTERKRYWIMILILGILFVFSALISLTLVSSEDAVYYNTAIIPIKGTITTESGSGLFSESGASSQDITSLIEKAKADKNVKAIIFEIDSPGGSPVATDEIASAIKGLKEDNITTVAWIRETGASGAYWVASSTDHIIANRMSIVGSIGVYGSYLEWYGLMDIYNVTYRRLVSGEYKDTGVPFRNLTEKEGTYLQSKLDRLHEFFIEAVAQNRNMPVEDVRKLATGEIFLGVEGKENGLVDELGSKEEAIAYLKSTIGEEVTTKEFSKDKSFIESLFDTLSKNSYYMGLGIGNGMFKGESGFKIMT